MHFRIICFHTKRYSKVHSSRVMSSFALCHATNYSIIGCYPVNNDATKTTCAVVMSDLEMP
uniref:Uncharacterized protein n=1 Tax=Babesia bovis TaxID=5865 RepID=S6B139_BABBO|nr:hypothetical protein [Babesia bovis]